MNAPVIPDKREVTSSILVRPKDLIHVNVKITYVPILVAIGKFQLIVFKMYLKIFVVRGAAYVQIGYAQRICLGHGGHGLLIDRLDPQ